MTRAAHRTNKPEPTYMKCNSCGSSMTLARFRGGKGGRFNCDKCEQCHVIYPDGTHAETVFTLFPSVMQEGSALYEKFLQHQESQFQMIVNMRLITKTVKHDVAEELLDDMRKQLETKRAEIASKRKWWRFWE